jgi:hypothetical protein
MKSTALFRIVKMIVLCGFSFFRYMRSSGLTGEPGLVILSSHEGADYGRLDLRRARTLISRRRLDLIKHLEMFVSSLVWLLPPETSFVGCFAQEGHFSAGRHRQLSRDRVSALLEGSGLVVIDMKEMNGLTYFHSRKREHGLDTAGRKIQNQPD